MIPSTASATDQVLALGGDAATLTAPSVPISQIIAPASIDRPQNGETLTGDSLIDGPSDDTIAQRHAFRRSKVKTEKNIFKLI